MRKTARVSVSPVAGSSSSSSRCSVGGGGGGSSPNVVVVVAPVLPAMLPPRQLLAPCWVDTLVASNWRQAPLTAFRGFPRKKGVMPDKILEDNVCGFLEVAELPHLRRHDPHRPHSKQTFWNDDLLCL